MQRAFTQRSRGGRLKSGGAGWREALRKRKEKKRKGAKTLTQTACSVAVAGPRSTLFAGPRGGLGKRKKRGKTSVAASGGSRRKIQKHILGPLERIMSPGGKGRRKKKRRVLAMSAGAQKTGLSDRALRRFRTEKKGGKRGGEKAQARLLRRWAKRGSSHGPVATLGHRTEKKKERGKKKREERNKEVSPIESKVQQLGAVRLHHRWEGGEERGEKKKEKKERYGCRVPGSAYWKGCAAGGQLPLSIAPCMVRR